MKRIFATLALVGAVLVGSVGTPAWAEEKPAAPAATAAAASTPAAAGAEKALEQALQAGPRMEVLLN